MVDAVELSPQEVDECLSRGYAKCAFTNRRLGKAAVEALCEQLAHNTTLLELDLSRTLIAHDEVAGLCRNLIYGGNTTLRMLELSVSHLLLGAAFPVLVGGAGAEALTTLVLHGIFLPDYITANLAETLGNNTTLKHLGFSIDNFYARSLNALAAMFRRNVTLKSLLLSGIKFIDNADISGFDVFMQAIKEENTTLAHLSYASSCTSPMYAAIQDTSSAICKLMNANRAVDVAVGTRAPPLGDGSGDCGAFDALPNEALSEIAELVWPTATAAFPLAHTCRRWRDVVLSDFVAARRCNVTPDADSGLLPRRGVRWVYRAAALGE